MTVGPDDSDLIESFQRQWDAGRPDEHFRCVPAVTRLLRVAQLFERRLSSNLGRFGLTRGEAEVLFALVRNPGRDLTPKLLQTMMLVSSGGLSNRLDRLEAKGLLERRPDARDGRGVRLRATPAGTELTLRVYRSHTEEEAKLIACLSPGDVSQLERLLRLLHRACPKPSPGA